MLADMIPPDKRPDAYALLRLSNNLGISVGPAIGGFMATLSYTLAFYGAAIGMISYSLMLTFLADETLPRRQFRPQGINEILSGYSQILGDRPFISFTATFTLVSSCAVLMWVLMPVYANNIFKVPESQYGLIPTTNALMVVLFQVVMTKFTKRYPPLQMMMVGGLFYALGVGSVALGHGFIGFWISMVVMTIGELILMPTSSTYVAGLAPADMRGRYMSIYGLTWNIAAGTAPVLGGYLNDNLSPASVWYGGLVVGLMGMLGFALLSRSQIRRQISLTKL